MGVAWAGLALGHPWLAAIGLAVLGTSVITAIVTLGRALALARG